MPEFKDGAVDCGLAELTPAPGGPHTPECHLPKLNFILFPPLPILHLVDSILAEVTTFPSQPDERPKTHPSQIRAFHPHSLPSSRGLPMWVIVSFHLLAVSVSSAWKGKLASQLIFLLFFCPFLKYSLPFSHRDLYKMQV